MVEPPEAIEAGEHFRFFSEVTSVCSSEEACAVPAGEQVSLVASAPRFGLLFVGQGGVLQAYSTVSLSQSPTASIPLCSVWCGGRITHLSRTCDSLTLLVTAVWPDDIPHILFFDVRTMAQQGARLAPYLQCCGSNLSGSRLTALMPSPTDPGCVALCTSAGDLTVLSVSENSVSYNTKKGIGAGAVGWSAKGKQLSVGCSNGSLALFKPDLTPVRVIAAPPLPYSPAPVTALVWFTNTEFFVCYQQENVPTLVYVNGPKDKPAQYLSYEDVCYSSEGSTPQYYHLCFVPEWNQLFVMSSGGVEMATLIKCDGGGWAQLFLDEGHRAEMHFVNVTLETYPLGVALDFASTKTFPLKEDQSDGPFPVFYTLSTGGELNIFHMSNKLPGATDLCSANPVERIPAAISVRTPQQYGMNIVIPNQPASVAGALVSSTPAHAAPLFGGAAAGSAGSAFSSVGVSSSTAAPFSNFGGVPASAAVSSASTVPGSERGGGLFSNLAPPQSESLFGGTPAASSSSSLFSLTQSAPTSSVFGGKPSVSGSSLFGGSTAGPSMFGSSASTTAAKSSGSVFGSTTAVSTSLAFPLSPANSGSMLSSNNSASTTTTATCSLFGGSIGTTSYVPSTQTFSAQVVTSSDTKASGIGSATLVPSSTSFSQGMAFNFSAPVSGSCAGSILQGSGASSPGTYLATTAGIGAFQPSSSPLTPTTQSAPPSQNRFATSDGGLGSIGSGLPVSQLGPRAGSEALPPPAYNINASAQQGNGQSPKTGLSSGPNSARQTPVREVAKARTAQQDMALMAQITEEQDRFNKELGEHFRISEQCEYKGGWEESMRSVQSVLSNTEESLVQHRKQSRELSDAVAELHTALLEFYSGYEDAKATCNRINDPDQAYLTEWRGLDRCSERRLQELRSKLHYIQSELSYANATLDTIASNRLNKQNNARNRRVGGGGPSGGSDDVYRTVLLTHKARLACERQLDQLAEKMGSLSVLSGHTLRTRSAPNTLRSSEGKYGISNDSLLVSYSEDNKENISNNSTVSSLTPAKQEKLWDLLQQRKTTPVRRSGRPGYSPSVDSLSSPVNRSRLTGGATLASASQLFAAAPSPALSALQKPQRHHDSLHQAPAAPSLPSTPVQGLSLNTTDRSLLMSMSSFGPPAKCSTPAAEPSPPATSQTGLKLGGGGLREQLGANLILGKPTGLNLDGGTKGFSNWQVPTSSIASAFQASSAAPSFATSSVVKTELGQQELSTPKSAGEATPKYEDITPPGTPDFPSDAAATADEASSLPKAPTNPLSALSSLVGKVPGMSTAGTVPAQGFFSATTQSSSLFAAIPSGSAAVEPTQVSGIMSGKPFSGFSPSASVSVASSPNSFGSNSGSAFAANAKAFTLLPRPESPATSSGGDQPATTSTPFSFGSSSFSFSTATTSTATSSSSAQNLTSSFAVSSTDGVSSSKAGGVSSLFSAPVSSSVGSIFSSLPKTTGSFPFGSTVLAATTSTNSLFAVTSAATSQPSLFSTSKGLFASSEPAVIKSELVTTTSTLPSFSVATAVKAEPLAPFTTSNLSSGVFDSTTSSRFNAPSSEKPSVLTSSLPTPSTELGAVSPTPASSVSSPGGLFSLATASAASASPSLFGALSKNSAITITAVTSSAHTSAPAVSTLTITPAPAIVVPSFAQPTSATTSSASTQSSNSFTPSLFGQASSSVSGTATIIAPSSQATSMSSLFVAPASGGSLFGGAPTATTTSSVFGGASSLPFGTPSSAGSGSIFASPSVTGSVFGAPATSGSSIFAASTTTTGATFGAPVTTSSVFGGLASGSSAFGAPASTALPFASSSSVFGAPVAASSGTSLFGGPPPTSGSSTSVFGSGSPFGAVAKPAVSGGSLFGGSTSGGSVFGGGNGTSNSASVFGGAATFGSSVSSAFGGGSNAGAGTVFGGGDNSGVSVSSVFGNNAAASGNSSSSVFGGAAANPAASGGSVFGGSGFGAAGQAPSSVFGVAPSVDAGGNSVFGSSSSSSAFGTSSGFGNDSAGGTSLFGNSNSMFTGLGGKPSSPTNKNVFGVSTGAVKPQTDLFGGGPGSSGAGVASPSLFGGSSAAAQARPSPAFGSTAAFGSPPKFGSAPAFGSPPAFGSAGGSAFGGGSVFGGTAAPTGGASLFGGGSSGGGSGFSSFANSSSTATFGGLAANSDSSTGFGASTAESNASVFPKANTGSSSFSSWR